MIQGDVPPTNITVIIGNGFSYMNFSEFRTKKDDQCDGKVGNLRL